MRIMLANDSSVGSECQSATCRGREGGFPTIHHERDHIASDAEEQG
jgi:hypothetical protein